MVFDRVTYKENARKALSGKWSAAMAVAIMATILSILSVFVPGLDESDLFFAIMIVFSGPLGVASAYFFLRIAQGKEATVNDFFSGLSYFVKAALVYVLVYVITFIGMLLLIVPGIIAAIGLMMTPYIVASNPKVGVVDALKLSWKMTSGYKMDLFIMSLSYLGWYIVVILTAGIANLYVHPYTQTAFANVYFALRDDLVNRRGEATYEDFGVTVIPMTIPSYEPVADTSVQAVDAQQADYEEEFAEEEAMAAQAKEDEEFAELMRDLVGEEEAEAILLKEQAVQGEPEIDVDIESLIGCIRDNNDDDDANYVPPSR